jgi:hypothetical protein
MLGLAVALIVTIALIGVAVGAAQNDPELTKRVLPAPIDSKAPKTLSTATFGMG